MAVRKTTHAAADDDARDREFWRAVPPAERFLRVFQMSEEAYALVQEAAMEAWRDQRPFRETLSERARAAALTPAELDRICDVSRFLGNLEPVFARVLASTWARGGEAAGGPARREAGGDG